MLHYSTIYSIMKVVPNKKEQKEIIMKKLLVLLLAMLTLAGCSSNSENIDPTPTPTTTPVVTETPSGEDEVVEIDAEVAEILTTILDGVQYGSMQNAITDENIGTMLFIDPIEGLVGASADAMIGSQAHSVVLVRVPEGTDVATVAADIEANVDPRKWICVEAEKVVVETKDNYILLVMSDAETTDLIVSNFTAE